MNLQTASDQRHCMKTWKVFDWVKSTLNIRLKETVKIKEERFDDVLCCDFKVPCNSTVPSTIWSGLGVENISGTLNIAFHCGCGGVMDVIVNGKKLISLLEGASFGATVSDLRSIEVRCHGSTGPSGFCEGKLKMVLHFHPFQNDNNCIDFNKTKCFLSDRCGNPLDPTAPRSIICEELRQENGRKNINVTLPEGKSIFLQKVNVLKRGFVTVELFNKKGDVCKKCTFPFSEIETFHLCAPAGTTLKCKIISFDCEAYIIPPLDPNKECLEIMVLLHICQHIKILGEAVMEIVGNVCKPRKNIGNKNCPTPLSIPQCPFSFTEHASFTLKQERE